MSSTTHGGTERDAAVALADDLEQLVWRRPGLTELALAKSMFGRIGYQQRVNSTCRRLFREGRVERHGTGGPGHPFTYYPGEVGRRGQETIIPGSKCGGSP
jgi:hypothetical protein